MKCKIVQNLSHENFFDFPPRLKTFMNILIVLSKNEKTTNSSMNLWKISECLLKRPSSWSCKHFHVHFSRIHGPCRVFYRMHPNPPSKNLLIYIVRSSKKKTYHMFHRSFIQQVRLSIRKSFKTWLVVQQRLTLRLSAVATLWFQLSIMHPFLLFLYIVMIITSTLANPLHTPPILDRIIPSSNPEYISCSLVIATVSSCRVFFADRMVAAQHSHSKPSITRTHSLQRIWSDRSSLHGGSGIQYSRLLRVRNPQFGHWGVSSSRIELSSKSVFLSLSFARQLIPKINILPERMIQEQKSWSPCARIGRKLLRPTHREILL